MTDVSSLTARRSTLTAPDLPLHDPGDVVLVGNGRTQYLAKVVARTWDGAYIVDPIRPEADAEERLAA